MKAMWLKLIVVTVGLGLAAVLVACDDDETTDGDTTPAPTATVSSETMAVTLYYGNDVLDPGRPDCSVVFPVERQVPSSASVAEAALAALFAGPTDAETAEGSVSQFSTATASLLIDVSVQGDTGYVNLTDFRTDIPGAGSSCGSMSFFAEVETTLDEILTFERAIYAIDGDPTPFYEFMQLGCDDTNDDCDSTPFE